jgi:ubiquinone/menaquinone biosynthesis C-methylase UbiE
VDQDVTSNRRLVTAEGSAGAARRQFGPIASAYATSVVHAAGPDLRRLVAAARLDGHQRILDVGCGAGHTALAVASGAREVVAVDVTPEMLAVGRTLARERRLTNVLFRRADATRLPFPAASFDLVTSRYSAHHYSDPAKALAEIARVVRPGGQFLLADTVAPEAPMLDTFMNGVELLRDRSHVRNCRVSEWEGLFVSAGLTPQLLNRSRLTLDGPGWVARSQTPEPMTETIRRLFDEATPAIRRAFTLKTGPDWGWTIPIALLRGTVAG